MQSFIQFLLRFHAVFLFLALEGVCMVLYLRSAEYPNAVVLHSANALSGSTYQRISGWKQYNRLGHHNDSLNAYNARLRNLLEGSVQFDTLAEACVEDSLWRQVYTYIPVRVIKNSVVGRNNFITLDRGSLDGLRKDMGVVTEQGIAGVVVATSDHFAVAMSVLHGKFTASAALHPSPSPENLAEARVTGIPVDRSPILGRLRWDGRSPRNAVLTDIPSHIEAHPGDTVRTTGFGGLFPAGWPIGRIDRIRGEGGTHFLELDVLLDQDMARLRHAYVVNYLFREERLELEQNADAL